MSNTSKIQVGRWRRQEIPLNQLAESICAWNGCERTTPGMAPSLTPGWRYIVMAEGILFERRNILNADRDGVLWPDHFIELDRLLKPLA